jgi:hypothetical protein
MKIGLPRSADAVEWVVLSMATLSRSYGNRCYFDIAPNGSRAVLTPGRGLESFNPSVLVLRNWQVMSLDEEEGCPQP